MSFRNRRPCSIEGCNKPVLARDWCGMHYQRWDKYGDPLITLTQPKGSGHVDTGGYHRRVEAGISKREHVRIAERALGHALPTGAEVHHVDENRLNNTPSNLVICPDRAYHQLLHLRLRAFAASGHYDWRMCNFCKKWDAPAQMTITKNNCARHPECRAADSKAKRARKSA